ncbi:galactokinase [Saliphagus sp. LR7]|uniref:galactokinase n=1 Tax=Saliphagus sp. LR7 TaxID=2282654 RepID=UPI000DF7483F|nr:galactokinase [Saliphagus sp. LR7]
MHRDSGERERTGGESSVDPVGEAFRERFGAEPTERARAPGRVNLVGGHTDYNDGLVLPVAIDRETVVAARARSDGVIRARSLAFEETITEPVGTTPEGWGAYVLGTASVLADEVGESVGADLAVGGDVTMGAGLSSSAALEVAVCGAIDAAHDLGLDRETIADVCWRAENEAVGMACGIMDQFTAATARSDRALRIDCRDRSVEHVPFELDAELVVVDTNVKHELIDSGFNDRVRECHEATARLDGAMGKRVRALRDVTPEEVEAHADALGSPHTARARHVTSEIRRVEAATEALAADDAASLGSLMTQSHHSLRDDYEVSCEELDAAVSALTDRPAVYGARMVGGGWGGSVVSLVEPGEPPAVAEAVRERYEEATGVACDIYAFDAGRGLTVE